MAEAELAGVGRVRVNNLSLEGAFIESRSILPAGRRARLQLSIPDRDITVVAVVHYCLPGIGMGVQFAELAPEDKEALARLIGQLPGA